MHVPKHLGIIMDGNRRFARRLLAKPWKGHEWGAKKLEQVLNWCQEYSIEELTLYTFSIQNFDRPTDEFNYLMNIFAKNIEQIRHDARLKEHKIRVNVIGRTWMFPQSVQDQIQAIMDETKDHDKFIINMAMAYGGREEVIDATRKIAQQITNGTLDINDINEEVFRRNLYTDHEPDLIIRTGGEQRTSNFLAFQGAYSEYVFVAKMWPEFEKQDFIECLQDYNNRKRRFGK